MVRGQRGRRTRIQTIIEDELFKTQTRPYINTSNLSRGVGTRKRERRR